MSGTEPKTKLFVYVGLYRLLGALKALLAVSRVLFTLWVIYGMIWGHTFEGSVDIALAVVMLLVSWWAVGQVRKVTEDVRSRLFVAVAKIHNPRIFEELDSLGEAEKQQLNQELLNDLQGGPVGAKIRAFNRGELPEAEMAAMRERFRKAGF